MIPRRDSLRAVYFEILMASPKSDTSGFYRPHLTMGFALVNKLCILCMTVIHRQVLTPF